MESSYQYHLLQSASVLYYTVYIVTVNLYVNSNLCISSVTYSVAKVSEKKNKHDGCPTARLYI